MAASIRMKTLVDLDSLEHSNSTSLFGLRNRSIDGHLNQARVLEPSIGGATALSPRVWTFDLESLREPGGIFAI